MANVTPGSRRACVDARPVPRPLDEAVPALQEIAESTPRPPKSPAAPHARDTPHTLFRTRVAVDFAGRRRLRTRKNRRAWT